MNPFNEFWITTTLALSTPLTLAAMGELMAERAGVLNIGLEGMMLSGAFFGFVVTKVTHSLLLGVLAGASAGVGLALIMGVVALIIRADQIIVGVGVNLLAAGMTSFLFEQLYGNAFVSVKQFPTLRIPLLSRIPVVGNAMFAQPLLAYVALVAVPVAWYVLYHTKWGLAVRATGETPAVADTAGHNVLGIRMTATLIAGAMAGLGGVFLSLSLGTFVEGMSSGRGFLAVAAVIFGRWRPWAALLGCLLFGGADALQLELQGNPQVPGQLWIAVAVVAVALVIVGVVWRRMLSLSAGSVGVTLAVAAAAFLLFVVRPTFSLPPQIWASLPYVLSLLVLAGFIGKSRMPTALSLPYRRETDV